MPYEIKDLKYVFSKAYDYLFYDLHIFKCTCRDFYLIMDCCGLEKISKQSKYPVIDFFNLALVLYKQLHDLQ